MQPTPLYSELSSGCFTRSSRAVPPDTGPEKVLTGGRSEYVAARGRNDPRQEPGAVVPHARIRAGGGP